MNLQEFFAALDAHAGSVPIDELTRQMTQLAVTRDELNDHIIFAEDRYQRNLLHLGSGYVALVLCWRSGQASPIHDHAGSACGVRVIEGIASETRYERGPDGRLSEASRTTFDAGHVCGSYDADIHVMHNEQPAGQNLVTLHVYTPPLSEIHTYSLESTEVGTWTDIQTLEAQRKLGVTAGS